MQAQATLNETALDEMISKHSLQIEQAAIDSARAEADREALLASHALELEALRSEMMIQVDSMSKMYEVNAPATPSKHSISNSISSNSTSSESVGHAQILKDLHSAHEAKLAELELKQKEAMDEMEMKYAKLKMEVEIYRQQEEEL